MNTGAVKKKKIDAKTLGEQDLQENHPEEYEAYQRIMAVIERGYTATSIQHEAAAANFLVQLEKEISGGQQEPDKS